MGKRKRIKNDISFFAHDPNRKKPITWSTQATNDFLVLIHNAYPGLSIGQLRDMLMDKTQFIYNPEAIAVLDAYIRVGEKEEIPNWK